MTSEEKQVLATRHYLSMKNQEDALGRLELALMYGQPAPPTPHGFSDARWRAVVNMYTRRHQQGPGA